MSDGCKECRDRYVGCHSRCETYREYLEELKKKKNIIIRAKMEGKEYNEYKKNKITKERKWYR